MNKIDINLFEKVSSQIEAFHSDISNLAKKSANDGVNEFKLKFINQVLFDANKLLKESYLPFKDFSQFDLEKVPSNSDVTFILSQYMNCLEKLRADNVDHDEWGNWVWLINGKETKIKTSKPKKL